MRPLKIGYLCAGSAHDVSNWSGLTKHIRDALEDCGHEIYDVDGFFPRVPLQTRLRGWQSRFLQRRPYGYDRDVALARRFADEAEGKINSLDLDCIVSAQTYPVTMLKTSVPVASWCDATFHALMGVYPGYAEISEDSIRQGHYLESNAIGHSCFLAYASHWTANDAVNFYGADPAKVAVIPFGANCAPAFDSLQEAESAIAAKTMKPFRVLFVGRDWDRKGGELAVAAVTELRRRGVDAELWIVGCDPFGTTAPAGVKCIGLLDKSQSADLAAWQNCFRQSHVLLVPTRAECFGVVFAEAAAFALPSIATNVGGVSDAVADGVSGFLLPLTSDVKPYADSLERLATDVGSYRECAASAYRHYERTLNWRTAAVKFSELLEVALDRSPSLRAWRYSGNRLEAACPAE